LINMGVEPYLINSSLVCVLAQRLVRKICDYCKEPYPLKREIAQILKINIDKIKTPELFKPKGCLHCFNTGYSGRIAIAEALILTPAVRDLILAHAQDHIIKQHARKEGMLTLREAGVEVMLKGLTTIEEVLRVTATDE